MFRKIVSCLSVLLLAACAGSPYMEGRSAADVPQNVNVVNLQKVILSDGHVQDKPSGDPGEESDPSQNEQEALAAAKTGIITQLTNFGYKVVQDPNAPADIKLSYFVRYQGEYGLFVHRDAFVEARAYDPASGQPLFHVASCCKNPGGLFGSMTRSRDDVVVETAQDATIKLVDEMRKGSRANVAVTANAN